MDELLERRLGDVAMSIPRVNTLTDLVGSRFSTARPFPPYHVLACDLLNDLSIALRSKEDASKYPDIMAFSFWCRKSNITKLKSQFDKRLPRLGLGVAFHIAPSNVPVNFAFSFAFGLLSGNGNIVRVPSNRFPQIDIICDALNQVLHPNKYSEIKAVTHFVHYESNDTITAEYSSNCDARLIWGGSETIRKARQIEVPQRNVEMAFSDRYSFCMMDAPSITELTEIELSRLAKNFFNDSYLMDQNACSSPHLVLWQGERKDDAKYRFWTALHKTIENNYALSPAAAVDKYTRLCANAIELENIQTLNQHGNSIYRMTLNAVNKNNDSLRGKFGYFYEYDIDDINTVSHIVNNKYQTLTYYGVDKSKLLSFVIDNRLSGIDRIVPVGSALNISVVWDGYDVIGTLSRIIDVQ